MGQFEGFDENATSIRPAGPQIRNKPGFSDPPLDNGGAGLREQDLGRLLDL